MHNSIFEKLNEIERASFPFRLDRKERITKDKVGKINTETGLQGIAKNPYSMVSVIKTPILAMGESRTEKLGVKFSVRSKKNPGK